MAAQKLEVFLVLCLRGIFKTNLKLIGVPFNRLRRKKRKKKYVRTNV